MSLNDYIAGKSESGVLTRASLDAAFKAIEQQPVHPCRLGRHVVSATALREKWDYAICGNCCALVRLNHPAE